MKLKYLTQNDLKEIDRVLDWCKDYLGKFGTAYSLYETTAIMGEMDWDLEAFDKAEKNGVDTNDVYDELVDYILEVAAPKKGINKMSGEELKKYDSYMNAHPEYHPDDIPGSAIDSIMNKVG